MEVPPDFFVTEELDKKMKSNSAALDDAQQEDKNRQDRYEDDKEDDE